VTAVLTTAGAAHLVELAQGDIPTNAFDALVFGKGNDAPAITDTLEQITERTQIVARLATGFPKQGDDDDRNSGAGASVWTWRFELEAGTPFVASNCAITNYSGGAFVSDAPLAVHAKQTVAQRHDERLIVWLNAVANDEPTVFTAVEQSFENGVQRVHGYVARNRALAGHPNGVSRSTTEVFTRPQPGQRVWSFADVSGPDGRSLRLEDVERFTVTRERLKASEGVYVPESIEDPVECHGHVLGALVHYDARSPHISYNVMHGYELPRGTSEGTYRLTYKLELCDGDLRGWTHIAEVGP